MKISELIKKLREIQTQYGDLDVMDGLYLKPPDIRVNGDELYL